MFAIALAFTHARVQQTKTDTHAPAHTDPHTFTHSHTHTRTSGGLW
jgi:hypothetical protein